MPTSAAASPFPTPTSADQLACDLSPASDPSDFPGWWTTVSQDSRLAGWFWNDLVPNSASTNCRSDTAATFWSRAVPANWAPTGNIGGWPWASGGYYTQTLWLHAIPENWATIANIGGWPSATGGYYAQWFWLHAVPDNWVGIGNIGGWPWATGGYYTQWLWLHAVPDNWAAVPSIGGWPWASGGYYAQWFWLHASPDNVATTGNIGGWPWSAGSYYTQWLWLRAIPYNWAFVADIGGWPWASGGYYAQWFWLHAIPDDIANTGTASVGGYYRQGFWLYAVPGNWVGIGNVGGWPWATGGYYTQWLWLHAVGDDWASVAGIAGSPWASGGYYKQWFWLHAVPDNWSSVADIGGWPSATGGYYAQWFWLHAVPDNWVQRPELALGHSNVQGNQGYFRFWFWEGAVPDAWSPVANIGGWTSATDGYYTQWFWLHAAPDEWASNPLMAVGGNGGVGYYDYVFYHFATVRDFAWRDSLSLAGSQGAGYFDALFHGSMGQSSPHYQQLLALASGHLVGAGNFVPVSTWFAPGTQAVVAFTFDTEGSESQTCAVSAVLKRQAVAATFYLTGFTADVLTSSWARCLSGFDIQNHTVDHPGAFDLQPRTFMQTLPNPDQVHQIRDNVGHIQARLPNAAVTSFRTPWCDSNKAIDGSVVQSAIASGMRSDRSVITVPQAAVQAGVVPPLGLSQFSLSAFPSPYAISAPNGQLVEFPFTYPSDWTAANVHGLDPRSAPPWPGAPGYAVTLWEREFDEVYGQNGVMVVLMHPWVQSPSGEAATGLDALITYMKSKPGVVFTTATTANLTFRVATGMSQ